MMQRVKMKKWSGGVLIGSLFMLLILRYGLMKNPIGETVISPTFTFNTSNKNPLEWLQPVVLPSVQHSEAHNQVISSDTLVYSLFVGRNISDELQSSLQTWNHMKNLVNHSQALPNALEAIQEAGVAWESVIEAIHKQQDNDKVENSPQKSKAKQCPYFLNKMNATELGENGYKLRIPCGLVQGSSITIIGIPTGLLGNFRIDLVGDSVPGEPDPPILLHYNVRLSGDKITEDPVIVQNTWTASRDWGEEERCPSAGNGKKVEGFIQCNEMVGKNNSRKFTSTKPSTKSRQYFPFRIGYLSVMTLSVGEEGIHMSVDGKHTTSFAFRENLEPWLVNEVKISEHLKLISVVASGLPTLEDLEHIDDLEVLKATPILSHKPLDLLVGVFSTANNFKRRMAVRRSWMQYPAVRSGAVAVRFFVGLHKNLLVNEELLNEAQTYGDTQLMPFVDYYSLITWKTVAICVFGTEVLSAKYVMKTDDDAFVRVDEVMASLNKINVNHGLLYGLINSDARPHRDPNSKWYISPEEWSEETYPPWAHGPGYVVSQDIAKEVNRKHKTGDLKMFKLEDVAMGIWIAEMKKKGMKVVYSKEERVYNEGCKDNYVVAHYQSPREMLCLWQKLQERNEAKCCGDR